MSKPWPTADQLLSWWLFAKLDEQGTPESPEQIRGWIAEFQAKPNTEVHAWLHDEFPDFSEEFAELS